LKKRFIHSITFFSFLFVLLIPLFDAQAAEKLPLASIVAKNYDLTKPFGVSVRDFETGQIVYSYNNDKPRSPASNLKLLTGAAALDLLGPDYRFTTKLYYDGTIENNTLNGNVFLVGGGDPTLLPKDLQAFAQAVKTAGIHHITGYVLGDVSMFSGSTLSPGVVPAEEKNAYAAHVSPLTLSPNTNYEAGTLLITVKPSSKVGAAGTYSGNTSLEGLIISNKTKTVKKNAKNTVSITRTAGTNRVIISGNIPIGKSATKTITTYNPSSSTLYAFHEAMKATGITFTNRYVVARRNLPESAVFIHEKKSMPLSDMYRIMMKKSSNPMADAFVKTLGYEVYGIGDFKNGIQAVKDYGNSIGLSMDLWTIVDGSGLSKHNKVPPSQLTLLMKILQQTPNYQTFYKGLIIGGHANAFEAGSLKDRFKEWNVRERVIGKTGYITGVHALTGISHNFYTNKRYIFSILSEQSSGSTEKIDNIVKAIVLYQPK
jgi:serine-type D-Ala-D-Ala carboxypeptidase/endopeptidase (penicillin-binding protein 4)